jgi:regulator of cell morphogenesis and NO signaling
MEAHISMIQTNTTLAELAIKHPAASRIFYANGLDFCCGGNRPLEEACEERGLTATGILDAIHAEDRACEDAPRWENRPLVELISHIVTFYHRRLREELPQLIAMAETVEQAHSDKPSRPAGLRDHLTAMHHAVLEHLEKEENVLFPMILGGRAANAAAPVHVMEIEHRDHAENLKTIRAITQDLTAPANACATWRALYLRLGNFEAELMEHIHLENNLLFRRALCE